MGPGAAAVGISGNNSSLVFNIASGVTVNISSLASPFGMVLARTGQTVLLVKLGANGGGICNAGSLTLSDCVVSNNATGNGGIGERVTDIRGVLAGMAGALYRESEACWPWQPLQHRVPFSMGTAAMAEMATTVRLEKMEIAAGTGAVLVAVVGKSDSDGLRSCTDADPSGNQTGSAGTGAMAGMPGSMS